MTAALRPSPEVRLVRLIRRLRPECWQVRGPLSDACAWLVGGLKLPALDRRRQPWENWGRKGRRWVDG